MFSSRRGNGPKVERRHGALGSLRGWRRRLARLEELECRVVPATPLTAPWLQPVPQPQPPSVNLALGAAALPTGSGSNSGVAAPAAVGGVWTALGPAPIPNGQTINSSNPVSGRVSAIAVDPINPNIVFAGAAQGGVYRSLDGGNTWTPLLDNADTLSIGAITIDPLNPSTVFVGTGEGNQSLDSFLGVGVYIIRNADGPAPVVTGPFHVNGSGDNVLAEAAITKILVDPTNDNTIFVSTIGAVGGIGGSFPTSPPSRGLYRSLNAQSAAPTFTKVSVATASGGNLPVSDMVLVPGNPDQLILNIVDPTSGGIYVSQNARAASPTFAHTFSTASFVDNGKLAIDKVGSTVTVLALLDLDFNGGTLIKSTDGGLTWPTTLPAASGVAGGQGWYDLAVDMDPSNPNIIYIAGAYEADPVHTLEKSTNGGGSFAPIDTGLHADSHVIVHASANPSFLYTGDDGGIWRSTDAGASWIDLNNTTFSATQFESLALHPTDRNFMIGGTQDNGTELMAPNGTWQHADFGDGGYALIDQNATDTTNVTMYHTYFNATGFVMGFGRVTNVANAFPGGWDFLGVGGIANGINDTDAVNFYAPMALGPGNPNTLYYGSEQLYRSTDRGTTMVSVGHPAPGVPISAIGISPQNDNVRIVGLDNGKIFATTTGGALVDVTGPIPGSYISRVVIDPHNANVAYVALAGFGLPAGQHIWKTTNLAGGGSTWQPAGAGIPDVPVNALVVDPQNSQFLYAGTDAGVYQSTDGGATWNLFGTGLPNVSVFDLAIQNGARVLRAATHGRGIYEISLLLNPVVQFSAAAYNVPEEAGTVTITVTRSGDLTPPVTVTYSVTDGTAVAGRDYVLPSDRTLTFGPGETTKSFNITLLDDGGASENESFTVSLDPVGPPATLGPRSTASVVILEDQYGQLQLAQSSYSVDESAGVVHLTVTRTNGLDGTVTVDYATNDGTAKARLDYTASSGTLTFAPGVTTQGIDIPILDDGGGEDDQDFFVNLVSVGGGATVGPRTSARVTILETQFGQLALDRSSYSVNEQVGQITVNVVRTGGSDHTVTVNYSTADGSAVAGIDYVPAVNQTLTFGPGETSKPITIQILDDGGGENDSTFSLVLTSPTGGATLGSPSSAPITIQETQFGTISLDAARKDVDESQGSVSFTVLRTGGSDGTVTVPYATAVNPSQADPDFVPLSGTLTFDPGETAKTVTIPLVEGSTGENDDSFFLTLGTPGGGASLGSPGRAEVRVHETQYGQFQFSAARYVVDEKSGVAVVTVLRTGGSDHTATVHYSTADGTAQAGVDYLPVSGTLVFQAGVTSQSFTVPLRDDQAGQADEYFTVSLDSPSLPDDPGQAMSLGDPATARLSIPETDFGQVQFSAAGYSTARTAGAVGVRVVRTGGSDGSVTVNFHTADGSARAGVDYTAESGTLTFGPGEMSQLVTIPLLDYAGAGDGSFSVVLDGPTGGVSLGTLSSVPVSLQAGAAPAASEVLDGHPGAGSAEPTGAVVVGGVAYYAAADGAHGQELWATDGTAGGTRLVADINPGPAGSSPLALTNVNGTLFFTADDGLHGRELWTSDGTTAGTRLVADILAGQPGSGPLGLTNVQGTLYFSADDGSDGRELWKSDGTAAGTVLVRDVNPGAAGSDPTDLTAVGSELFFAANNSAVGVELFKSDGTALGTVLVKDINPFGDSQPRELTNVNGRLFFTADNGTSGRQLWATDGGSSRTAQLVDQLTAFATPATPAGSSPHGLVNVGGTLFFGAVNTNTGYELWRSDGTADGTVLVKDVQVNRGGSDPRWLTGVGGTLFFVADGSAANAGLWKSDGTSAGTVLVTDAFPGGAGAPADLTAVGGRLYFTADDGVHGRELWTSDGTAAGTRLVADLVPGPAGSSPAELLNLNGGLLFRAEDPATGAELWRVNVQGPSATVPGPQQAAADGSLVFSSATGNAITVANPSGGQVQVMLTATGGVLTLSHTDGLTLLAGNALAGGTLSFSGPVAAINAALEGLRFTPAVAAGTPAGLTVTVSDPTLGPAAFGSTATTSVAVVITPPDPPAGPPSKAPVASGPAPVVLAVAGPGGSVVFAVSAGHSVYRWQAASGWTKLGDAIESISAATDASGQAVLYVVTLNHALARYSDAAGWQLLGAPGTIRVAGAGTDLNGSANVYVLTAAGDFMEFGATGWRQLGSRGSVQSFSAADAERVVVVTADRSLAEFDGRRGWVMLSGAGLAESVSARSDGAGNLVVWVVTPAHALYRLDTSGWAHLGDNIRAVSVGRDPAGAVTAQTVGGGLFRFDASTGWRPLSAPGKVAGFQAADVDRAFVSLADGSLVGFDDAFGFFPLAGPRFLAPASD